MKVVDLKADLADGVKLINFLEIATGKSVGKYYDKPKMDLHKIQNFHVALNFIKSLGIRLHGIAAEGVSELVPSVSPYFENAPLISPNRSSQW